ncbi:MAG: hypothetical protein YK1309IOTA_1090011 [Marine Group I thaumarchaeote]|nr:MAG: hypothetical protein YK1309IOTA_1090011 [Marine Group I thaumarchaeote]
MIILTEISQITLHGIAKLCAQIAMLERLGRKVKVGIKWENGTIEKNAIQIVKNLITK